MSGHSMAFLLNVDRQGELQVAKSFSGSLFNTTSNGILVEVNASAPEVIAGTLLAPTPEASRYVLELDSTLSNATPLSVHSSSLESIAVADDGMLIAAGSFNNTEVLPNGTLATAVGSYDIYLSRFDQEPLSLPAAEKVIVFEDSFETGSNSNDWASKWVEDSQNDWHRSTQRSTLGSRSAEVDGRATDAALTMAQPADLSEFTSATLQFHWYIESGFDTGEYLAADVWNGSEWIELDRLKGNETSESLWFREEIKIAPEWMTSEFKVRFRSQVSSSWEDANVDDVRITAIRSLGAPNATPTADAGGPYSSNEGQTITLDASGSFDSDGSIVSYAWDVDGDGNYDDASGVAPSVTFNQDGTRTIGLRVTDDGGKTNTSIATVTVTSLAPTANAGGPYASDEGSTISLDGSASTDPADDIVAYEWDLDSDGVYETSGPIVDFISFDDGEFSVSLRVTDDGGLISTSSTSISIANVAPTADAGGPYVVTQGEDATVSAAASTDPGNDIATYEWDLDGDGDFDDATGITTVFNAAVSGAFTIQVRVTDDDGQASTDLAVVTVSDTGPEPLDESDLVAHWTLDGTTVDSAPFGAVADNGTLTGNATLVGDTARGQAMLLDGNGDYLDVRDSTDLNKTIVSERTISLWFNANEVDSRQVLFEEGGGSRGLSIYLDTGQLYIGGWNKPQRESGWGGTFLSTNVTAGEWHNVVLTLDGSTSVQSDSFKGYLDGSLFGSGKGSQLWGHSGDVGIGMMDDATVFHDGNDGGDGYGFAGRMDDVRIYDRVFASEEAETLWLNY